MYFFYVKTSALFRFAHRGKTNDLRLTDSFHSLDSSRARVSDPPSLRQWPTSTTTVRLPRSAGQRRLHSPPKRGPLRRLPLGANTQQQQQRRRPGPRLATRGRVPAGMIGPPGLRPSVRDRSSSGRSTRRREQRAHQRSGGVSQWQPRGKAGARGEPAATR